MKFKKREIKRYGSAEKYIKEELKTGRDIVSSLGSAGITFNDDIKRFYEYCVFINSTLTKHIKPLLK